MALSQNTAAYSPAHARQLLFGRDESTPLIAIEIGNYKCNARAANVLFADAIARAIFRYHTVGWPRAALMGAITSAARAFLADFETMSHYAGDARFSYISPKYALLQPHRRASRSSTRLAQVFLLRDFITGAHFRRAIFTAKVAGMQWPPRRAQRVDAMLLLAIDEKG